MNFHETNMGNEFYNGTMQGIAKSLENISETLDAIGKNIASTKSTSVEEPKKEMSSPNEWVVVGVDLVPGVDILDHSCAPEWHFSREANYDSAEARMGAMILRWAMKKGLLGYMLPSLQEISKIANDSPRDRFDYGDYAAEWWHDGHLLGSWKIERWMQ